MDWGIKEAAQAACSVVLCGSAGSAYKHEHFHEAWSVHFFVPPATIVVRALPLDIKTNKNSPTMPTVLITGASRGIGLGLARVYAESGWRVIATARSPAKAAELSAIAGITVESLEVTDAAAVDQLAAKYKDTPIDVLINNAGVLHREHTATNAPTLESFRDTFETNVYAPLKIAIAFGDSLRKAAQPKLVGISSTLGSIGLSGGGYTTYRGSKAALNAIYHSLAVDLKRDNITVLPLHPGWVQTDMGGANAALTVEASARGLKNVIDNATIADTGRFMQHDGKELPW
jgi:NAD(P)-dependent dehydrogenase (short-subunit alcohol dehydrogenase family)